MTEKSQKVGILILVLAAIALTIAVMCTMGCATEIESPQQWVEAIAKDKAKGEDRRLMEKIEPRLLPAWTVDLPGKVKRNWGAVTFLTTIAGGLGFGVRHKAQGRINQKKVSDEHRQEMG